MSQQRAICSPKRLSPTLRDDNFKIPAPRTEHRHRLVECNQLGAMTTGQVQKRRVGYLLMAGDLGNQLVERRRGSRRRSIKELVIGMDDQTGKQSQRALGS